MDLCRNAIPWKINLHQSNKLSSLAIKITLKRIINVSESVGIVSCQIVSQERIQH